MAITLTTQSGVTAIAGEIVPCDYCGSNTRRQLFSGPDRLMGRPGTFSFARCSNCGLIYQSPRLPWQQLATYYEGEYDSYAKLMRDEPSPLHRAIKRYGVQKQRWHLERYRKSGTLLEVGCGTGLFLEEMQRSRSWQLYGLEPTREAAAYVRQRLGIPVIEQIFEQASLKPASMDMIVMWHVLEHLISPMRALHKAYELLRPGGHLVFSVPNYESLSRKLFGRFWVGWDLPRHLFVFPRLVLQRMLADSGFGIVDDRCFLISYALLGHSLNFWAQDWSVQLKPFANRMLQAYYSIPARLGLFPAQLLVEQLGLASVTIWTVQKQEQHATA